MIILNNSNKLISNKTIYSILSLLDDYYRELDISIVFINNRFSSLKYIFLKEYIHNIPSILSGSIGGSSCLYYNKIFIYTFIHENSEISKLHMIEDIIHEVFHQFQKQCKKEFFEKYNANNLYKKNTEYKYQVHEIQAKFFASDFMKNNLDKLLIYLREEERYENKRINK